MQTVSHANLVWGFCLTSVAMFCSLAMAVWCKREDKNDDSWTTSFLSAFACCIIFMFAFLAMMEGHDVQYGQQARLGEPTPTQSIP